MIVFLCCIASSLSDDSMAEGSESSAISTKLSSSKTSLNAIPSAPAQKTTVMHQSNSISSQPSHHQQAHHYVPQYYFSKPLSQVSFPAQYQHTQSQHQPAAMFIIAQPAQPHHQGSYSQGPQSPLFQQAVQQLLSYYNNNPQAKYQLLHQQQGHVAQPVAQRPQNQEATQAVYHAQMPTGAIHVIQSPHLEAQNTHLVPQSQQVQAPTHQAHTQTQSQGHQPTYVIPAQSQQILQGLGISPDVLTQFAQSQNSQNHQRLPVQFASHQYLAQQYPTQYLQQHQVPQFAQHYITPQFVQPQYQAQIPAHLPSHIQLSSSGLGQSHQFGLKQVTQSDYQAQTEKSQQASSSSNYNPTYKTAYVKG